MNAVSKRVFVFMTHLTAAEIKSGWQLVRRRGCRAGRRVQLHRAPTTVRQVSVSILPASRSEVSFGCLNVRSLLNKTDDVIEVIRDRHLDVLCLTETWHDADSVCVGRLRNAGFNVVDRPRPCVVDDMSTNHGGVAIVSMDCVVLSPVAVAKSSTFEHVCTRINSGRFSCITVVLYRPGSVAVRQQFFQDLAALLEQVATYQVPVFITGDFNIRLDRPNDVYAVQLRQLLGYYGMTAHESGPTHQLGGALDVLITRDDAGRPDSVSVIDVGLSDHHLLQWTILATCSSPSVETLQSRSWRKLDVDVFRSALLTSRLCHQDLWPAGADDMAALYATELHSVLDQLITRQKRVSDPWFDAECRIAKHKTQQLERAHAAACRRS